MFKWLICKILGHDKEFIGVHRERCDYLSLYPQYIIYHEYHCHRCKRTIREKEE